MYLFLEVSRVRLSRNCRKSIVQVGRHLVLVILLRVPPWIRRQYLSYPLPWRAPALLG